VSLDPLAVLARIAGEGWLVGGAVRDRLLGRPTTDYDVAVPADPKRLARALGRSADGHVFKLSDGFGAWRVVARDRTWQLDLLPVAGETIEEDLSHRDVTVNAIALPLGGGEYVDPFGGVDDLRAGRLRMVTADAFARDPLRVLRVARLSCELGFSVEPSTASTARASAGGLGSVAPERILAELKRIVVAERVLDGLALMDDLGATEVVLPELSGLRGVEQSHFHHLDVHDHTRAVLAETIDLVREPERWLEGAQADALSRVFDEPLANELTRGEALRFGALFHDIAKPATRRTTTEGRITFVGHDAVGAKLAEEVLSRLRASQRLIEYVADLVRHHLRLGFLVHQMPLDRHTIYHYLRACEPVGVDVTVLSVADRLATRGRGADAAIARHVELARIMLDEALAWRAQRPRPPVRGDELARAVGLSPGPEVGRILADLEEASFAGEIASPDQAIELARELAAQWLAPSDRLPGRERPGP
jgi:putative nucleotidyltransferase with HDIG domain